jgi:hypothetical protein
MEQGMFARKNAPTVRFRNAQYKFVSGMAAGSPAFAMARFARLPVLISYH